MLHLSTDATIDGVKKSKVYIRPFRSVLREAPVSAQRSDDERPDYLTPVVYHTLLALSQEPKHGYGISQEVSEVTEGRVTMGPGTLYGTLQRLNEKGWVRRTEQVDSAAPHAERRRYYELTRTGRAVLRDEARRLARAAELARERAVLRGS